MYKHSFQNIEERNVQIQDKLILPSYIKQPAAKSGCYIFYDKIKGLVLFNQGIEYEFTTYESEDDETTSTISELYPNLKHLVDLEKYESKGFYFDLSKRTLIIKYLTKFHNEYSEFFLDLYQIIKFVKKNSRSMKIRRILIKNIDLQTTFNTSDIFNSLETSQKKKFLKPEIKLISSGDILITKLKNG